MPLPTMKSVHAETGIIDDYIIIWCRQAVNLATLDDNLKCLIHFFFFKFYLVIRQ